MSAALITLTNKLASNFDMGESGSELVLTLKATAFKGDVSDAQMMALLIVANQYRLNPWTKEIYAFPDKNNGIVPVVGVDGWSRIINQHPQFDGMEFVMSENMVTMEGARVPAPEWIECSMYRKDRSKPIVVREYLDEVYREPFKGKYGVVTGPWQTHPKRFERHKAMIQCARVAFGFVGIYDQDEAERIVEKDMGAADVVASRPASRAQATLPAYTDEQFSENLSTWRGMIDEGKASAEQIIARISSKYELSAEQVSAIRQPATAKDDHNTIDADDWASSYEQAEGVEQ